MKEKIKNIILITLIVIFCMSISPITMQNDTYYTIAIGEHILENGIDMKDPFSWHEDLPYTYPHWAYDVATFLVYSVGQTISGEAGGYVAIYLTTALLSAILGIVLFKVNKKISKNTIISFAITLLTIYSLRGYIAARAQLVTFILFVLEIYCIEMLLQEPKKRYILGLLIIPILIANLHLAVWWFYFVLYLPYIAEYILTKVSKCENRNVCNRIQVVANKNIKYLIIMMIICLFTGFLTPLGTTPYTYLIKTILGSTTHNISEHLPMTLMQHAEIVTALGVILAIFVCTKAKLKISDAFMLFGLMFLMFYSRRQQSIFLLVGCIILNKLLVETLENYKDGAVKTIEGILLSKFPLSIISLLVVVLSVYFIVQKEGDTFVNKLDYPVEASEWIIQNLDLNEIRLFNEYNYGSYLLYKGIPVFIDSRADLYAPEFNTPTGKTEDGRDIFMDFIDASNLNGFYEDTFEKYDITHIILDKNSKMNLIISNTNDGKYNCLYEDKYFIVYKIEEQPIRTNLLESESAE